MKTAFRRSFGRHLKKLRRDPETLRRVRQAIESVEASETIEDLPGLKKLSAGSGDFYRIRVGDYRIGLELEEDELVFVVCLHRRDIYRYFP